MRDFEPPRLTRMDRPAQRFEGFEEKRSNKVRLKSPRLGPLHLFLDCKEPIRTHRLLRERVPIEQGLEMVVVQGLVDLCRKTSTHIRRGHRTEWPP